MNEIKIAQELVKIAQELVAVDPKYTPDKKSEAKVVKELERLTGMKTKITDHFNADFTVMFISPRGIPMFAWNIGPDYDTGLYKCKGTNHPNEAFEAAIDYKSQIKHEGYENE